MEEFRTQQRQETGHGTAGSDDQSLRHQQFAVVLYGRGTRLCCAVSYRSVARSSQYDLWPGVNEMVDGRLKYAGRPALVIGSFDKDQEDRVLRLGVPERLEGPFQMPV